jgi:hypothetical protein
LRPADFCHYAAASHARSSNWPQDFDEDIGAIWGIAAIPKQKPLSNPGRHVIVPDRQSKLMVAARASKNANLGTATKHWHDRDQMHFHTTTAIG